MITDTYRTKLGTEFKFGFERAGDSFVIHILDQPSYGGRDDDPHTTHRHGSGDERTVCWTGPMPSLEIAKNVAGFWADYTERYILTGQKFPGE